MRTDFVLSAEIVVIALGVVADAPLGTRIAVLAGLGLLMTVGVYGLVAAIVRLDDLGLHLARDGATGLGRAIGRGILVAAPWMMKALSVAGTVAMFLVGGGILVHGVPGLHHAAEAVVAALGPGPALGGVLRSTLDALVGLVAGTLVLAGVTLVRRGMAGR